MSLSFWRGDLCWGWLPKKTTTKNAFCGGFPWLPYFYIPTFVAGEILRGGPILARAVPRTGTEVLPNGPGLRQSARGGSTASH